MMLILLVLLAALLTIYLIRVISLEGNAPNSFIVVPLILGILVTGVMEYRWENTQTKGSQLVTYVSGVTNSNLQCQRLMEVFYDWNPTLKGYVDKKDPTTVHIKYSECLSLEDWVDNQGDPKPTPTSEQAFALHLLVFEANKIKTGVSDIQAECSATSQYLEVATYAGATPAEAQQMLDMYKNDWYPNQPETLKQPCP